MLEHPNKIESVEQLKQLSSRSGGIEIRILVGGVFWSTKEIHYIKEDDSWEIHHYIVDDFRVYTSTEDMLEQTRINEYIKHNIIIMED